LALEIQTYNESLAEATALVFNRGTEGDEFVVPLTPQLFADRIASKDCFTPGGCFLAFAAGQPVGLALTCVPCAQPSGELDPDVGAIDGLFFPRNSMEVGEQLVDTCIDYLRGRGARLLYGFASGAGYPFWREIYYGLEPVCATACMHAWAAFMSRGFEHHQQSVNYLGRADLSLQRDDLEFTDHEQDTTSPWARDSWRGLTPRSIRAHSGGRCVGHIHWADMPLLSEHRAVRTAGISGMWVEPDCRRRGIASGLVARLHETARAQGIAEILVGTRVGNPAARHTYEGAGMRPVAFRTGTRRLYE
jgi:ribosomal protein S18 acetylase RimI-like enzyme